ncbi:MAG TPA: hypothetical protein VLA56_08330 [Pseudomonadales bacterium]|nr:hypothetical protein [Pseudomonadales bacterium]
MEDWAIMVVLIVLISVGSGVVNRWLKLRAGGGGARVEELEKRLARLESLEARVRTLETIATDPRTELAREIRGLDDGRG